MHGLTPPLAEASLLIRKPRSDVFSAFTDPAKLTAFWLAHASAPLSPGVKVHWKFLVPGAEDDLEVLAFEQDTLLQVRWSDGSEVRWSFERHAQGTIVRVESGGFGGSAAEKSACASENTQGFTLVLAELKTWLETGRSPGIVRDKALLIAEKQRAHAQQPAG